MGKGMWGGGQGEREKGCGDREVEETMRKRMWEGDKGRGLREREALWGK